MLRDDLLLRKRSVLMPCMYHFYKEPPVLVRGSMQYLYDDHGKKYLDCFSGVSVMNCGHANPAIVEPVIEQLKTLQHTTTIYLTEPIIRLAESVVRFLGAPYERIFFVNSGSEANEGALLLAKLYTGKNGFVSLNGGLHGRTSLTMNVTGIDMWRTDPDIKTNCYRVPRPFCKMCELGKQFPSCRYACVEALDRCIERAGDIAAFIAEPIQGNGGIIVPPEGYYQEVYSVLRKHGVLLIADEVQTGFGRTGKRWGFEHYQVKPDIVTGAKALGSGLPLGFFAARNDIAQSYTRPGASTTGGNPVSAAAGIAVIAYIEKERLVERSHAVGAWLMNKLRMYKDTFSYVYDIRGKGLMSGIELRQDQALVEETDRVLERMKDHGFLLGKTGVERNVITLMPPLITPEEDLENMYTHLYEELKAIAT